MGRLARIMYEPAIELAADQIHRGRDYLPPLRCRGRLASERASDRHINACLALGGVVGGVLYRQDGKAGWPRYRMVHGLQSHLPASGEASAGAMLGAGVRGGS